MLHLRWLAVWPMRWCRFAELRTRARAAEALTKRPPGALSHTKALVRNFEAIAAQIDRESVIFKERLQTAEAREAFTAFAERRPPKFSSAAG
jgi:enoyl-CoA hydratase/carnithine racemase